MLILNRVFIFTQLTMNGECMVNFYTSITVLFIMAATVFYLTSFSNESLLILIVAAVILSGLSLLNHKTNYKRLAQIVHRP
ncbi:hypothetical protein ACQKML_02630 [Peribacillus frigoritolerans]